MVVAIVTAIVGPAAGFLVSWGGLGQKIRGLEREIARIEPIEKLVATIDARTTESAKSQGERLERAQKEVDRLTGEFKGVERGLIAAARGRTRTSAEGHQTGK